MKILVLNSGSSSLKFQVMDMPSSYVICKGIIERLGQENTALKYQNGKKTIK